LDFVTAPQGAAISKPVCLFSLITFFLSALPRPGTPSCHAEAFAQVEAKNRKGGLSSEKNPQKKSAVEPVSP